MRWFLIFCLLFLASCTAQTTAVVPSTPSNQNTSANQAEAFTNRIKQLKSEQEEKVKAFDIQNERFKIVPEEFKKIDFENFTYPTDYPKRSITLKNGEFEYQNTDSNGGGWFNFGHVYFVDLTNDEKKEALVLLSRVDCGGSCDGGAVLLYVFRSGEMKPVWKHDFGSKGYGCGLRTLTVREKTINFDVFGRCDEKMQISMTKEESSNTGKFSFFGYTEYVFKFDGKKFVREKMDFHQTEKIYSDFHLPGISIND